MLSGFGFLLGIGDFPREVDDTTLAWELLRSGTTELARRLGFLCVISDLSTLRSFEVIAEPWFSCSKTEDMSPLAGALETATSADCGRDGAGWPPRRSKFGSGGGGGGARGTVVERDWICVRASGASMPSRVFHVKPLG